MGVACVRCVRKVRRAPICRAAATASGIERCSGCGAAAGRSVQHLQPRSPRERRFRNRFRVREVCDRSHAVAEHGAIAVRQHEGGAPASPRSRRRVGLEGRAASSGLLVPGWAGARRRCTRSGAPAPPACSRAVHVEGARWRTVKARKSSIVNVVRVSVREQHGVDGPDARVHELESQLGRVSMRRRRPPDSISRRRAGARSRGSDECARTAVASDLRHPVRRARAEEHELHLTRLDLEEVGGPGHLPRQPAVITMRSPARA